MKANEKMYNENLKSTYFSHPIQIYGEQVPSAGVEYETHVYKVTSYLHNWYCKIKQCNEDAT